MHAGRRFCLQPCRFAARQGGGHGGQCSSATPPPTATTGGGCVWAAPSGSTAGSLPAGCAPAPPRALRPVIEGADPPAPRRPPPPSPAPLALCACAAAGEPSATRPLLPHSRLPPRQRRRYCRHWRRPRPLQPRHHPAGFAGGHVVPAVTLSSRRCHPRRAQRRRCPPPPPRRSPPRHCHCHHPHPRREKSSRRPALSLPSPRPRLHRHAWEHSRPRHRCRRRRRQRVAPRRRPPPPSHSRWTAAQGCGPPRRSPAWLPADAAAPQTTARGVVAAVAAAVAAWPPAGVAKTHCAGGGVSQADPTGGRPYHRCRHRRRPRRPRGRLHCRPVGQPTVPDAAGCAACPAA